MKNKFLKALFSLLLIVSFLPVNNISLAKTNEVVINEVESKAENKGKDWVEIYNKGTEPVDISGWYILDNDTKHTKADTKPLKKDTIINPNDFVVLTEELEFNFGLGKDETVKLYNDKDELVDSFSWTSHALDTFGRIPDGIGEFVETENSMGKSNVVKEEEVKVSLKINEINSAPDDWVEIVLDGKESLDISGYEIRDNSDDHRWKFPENTVIKNSDYLVVDAKSKGFVYNKAHEFEEGTFEEAIGIGSGDSIRLYDEKGNLIDSYSWTEHASYDGDDSKASFGRYYDREGSFVLMPETRGKANDWYRPQVEINEIESNGDETDWVEIINIGKTPVDISGWYILDNDPVGHLKDTKGLKDGTILKPEEVFVFDENKDFTFGLGKEDLVSVHIPGGAVVTSHSWVGHANGVLARIPDGVGEFKDVEKSTKNAKNIITNPVILNEIQSNDKNDGPDWIELANPLSEDLNISGLVIKDDDDSHSYVIPENTIIEKEGFLVITSEEFGFGLGKSDMVRIFEKDILIQSTKWEGHTNPTWGLYPDINGSEYKNTLEETKGKANKFAGIPIIYDAIENESISILDNEEMFLEDSSGLNFHNDKLYAVDNGTGIFWEVKIGDDNSIEILNKHRVRFKKDEKDSGAKGPDSEGITVDENNMVYVASERDNSDKKTNYNKVLMVNPNSKSEDLVAEKEWDLTNLLPNVSANMGIEAIEWIPKEHIENKVVDINSSKPFSLANYPKSINQGIFTVALEDNGHVYGFVLNEDETTSLIFDIDSKLGGAMALNYDEEERLLWVGSDNGYNNMRAVIEFNGTEEHNIAHVRPPKDLPNNNFEGFAISKTDKDGNRKVFWFEDGVKSKALRISNINGKYRTLLGFEQISENSNSVEVETFKDIYEKFETKRVKGYDRFETAAKISEEYFEKADTVILSSGREFVDALTVSPLGSKIGSPILLSENSSVPKVTLDEIKRLEAKNIIIAGGNGTVSKEVEQSLKDSGYNVTRLSGNSRFETAVKIGEEVRKNSTNNDEVIITSGRELVDALSANNIAGKKNIPIILTEKNKLHEATKKALKDWNIKTVTVVGGDGTVSDSVLEEISKMDISVIRISGKDRFETAIKVSKESYKNPNHILLANGRNSIDALVAGAIVNRLDAPLLLIEKDTLPVSLKDYLNNENVKNITIFGGDSSISK